MKFGRNRPKSRPHHCMTRYLDFALLPPAPPSCDYAGPASGSISNIFGNDRLGDCVIAGGAHLEGVATGNAGSLWIPTLDEVIADYSAIGGYVPGEASSDQGCDEVVALQYWQTHGFANGTKIAGAVAVDATKPAEVQVACWLFEGLMFGIELPNAWVSPMPNASGFTWDTAGGPNPDQGHCVVGVGYQPAGVTIATWGMLGTLTWDAISTYCTPSSGGGLYVMLTPDVVSRASQKAPTGFDWTTLLADFRDIGGSA